MTSASHLAFLDHPDALRVRKRCLPVRVAFAVRDGVCETLEGSVRYRAGDALLTGDDGGCWPIRRPAFDAAYSALPGNEGFYVKIVAAAVARRLDERLQAPAGWQADLLTGRAGDWLLAYTDGTFGILRDDIFRATYEADDGETRWPPPSMKWIAEAGCLYRPAKYDKSKGRPAWAGMTSYVTCVAALFCDEMDGRLPFARSAAARRPSRRS